MRRIIMLIPFVLLIASLSTVATAQDEPGARDVFARATCTQSSGSRGSTAEVTIRNQYGRDIVVAYVHAGTTSEALNPRFAVDFVDPFDALVLEDGATTELTVPWDHYGIPGEATGFPIVVTSAGIIAPGCDDEFVGLEVTPGALPEIDDDVLAEDAAAFLATYITLIDWHAYAGLYELLHPDVQAVMTLGQMSCGLADMFGSAESWGELYFSAKVEDLTIGDWTWKGNGETYEAVKISFMAERGTMTESTIGTATMHLVPADGMLRWFFGASPETISAMPSECGLG